MPESAPNNGLSRPVRRGVLLCAVVAGTWLLVPAAAPGRELWPPVVSLLVIVGTRRALAGLLAGGMAGAILLQGGDPWQAYLALFADHLAPALQSPWQTGAVAFTLILGGMAVVLEKGGGFTTLLRRLAPPGRSAGPRVELAAGGLGLLCFFDGLANSMVVGRVSRGLADASGVARVKLAYIVDSTSSAVACVALISTWIAFQLGLIGEAFELAGRPSNPYVVFLRSLPYNFHCWFTLMLLWVAIRHRFHPGPMAGYVREAEAALPDRVGAAPGPAEGREGPVPSAIGPLIVLLLAFGLGFLVFGDPQPGWPNSRERVVAAFGSAAGPLVLVTASLLATVAAVAMFPGRERRLTAAGSAFTTGVRAMFGPVGILLAAWILGSVTADLGTATLISRLLTGADILWLIPTLTFLTGAVISFTTGTSWGTMGLLFPLAVPAAAQLGAADTMLSVVVGAVFSGAVFGDHCSPFSDTTIVTAISCGVDPHDHVRTQLPYALLAAAVAVLVGFVPAGLGAPVWLLLPTGALVLWLLPKVPFLSERP